MRAGPTSILALVGALALGFAALSGCAPTGADSEQVTPEIVAVNPELATLPDIPVVEDIAYGGTAEQPLLLDACLPKREDDAPVQNATASDDEAGPPRHRAAGSRGARARRDRRRARRQLERAATRPTSPGARSASGSRRPATSRSRSTTVWRPANVFPAAIDDVQAAVALAARRRAAHPLQHRPGSHRRVRRVGRRQPGRAAGHARVRRSHHRIPRRGRRRAERADRPHRSRRRPTTSCRCSSPTSGARPQEDCPAAAEASPFYAIDASDPPFFVGALDGREDPASAGRAVRRRACGRPGSRPSSSPSRARCTRSRCSTPTSRRASSTSSTATIGTPPDPLVQPGDRRPARVRMPSMQAARATRGTVGLARLMWRSCEVAGRVRVRRRRRLDARGGGYSRRRGRRRAAGGGCGCGGESAAEAAGAGGGTPEPERLGGCR